MGEGAIIWGGGGVVEVFMERGLAQLKILCNPRLFLNPETHPILSTHEHSIKETLIKQLPDTPYKATIKARMRVLGLYEIYTGLPDGYRHPKC